MEALMRAQLDLRCNSEERSALRALSAEEREAVVDSLLQQVRQDLEWVVSRAAEQTEPVPRKRNRRTTLRLR
jgi:hypothetical protein